MMTIRLDGADRIVGRLAGFPTRARARLDPVISGLGEELLARVEDNLDGAVLQRRSGRLAAAQQARVESDAGAVSVAVGFDPGQVSYGAIQEFGGTTRAHLIEARRGFALAFTSRDRLVFARRVNHPGSVIPERSYLRSALAELASGGVADIAASIGAELEP